MLSAVMKWLTKIFIVRPLLGDTTLTTEVENSHNHICHPRPLLQTVLCQGCSGNARFTYDVPYKYGPLPPGISAASFSSTAHTTAPHRLSRGGFSSNENSSDVPHLCVKRAFSYIHGAGLNCVQPTVTESPGSCTGVIVLAMESTPFLPAIAWNVIVNGICYYAERSNNVRKTVSWISWPSQVMRRKLTCESKIWQLLKNVARFPIFSLLRRS